MIFYLVDKNYISSTSENSFHKDMKNKNLFNKKQDPWKYDDDEVQL